MGIFEHMWVYLGTFGYVWAYLGIFRHTFEHIWAYIGHIFGQVDRSFVLLSVCVLLLVPSFIRFTRWFRLFVFVMLFICLIVLHVCVLAAFKRHFVS